MRRVSWRSFLVLCLVAGLTGFCFGQQGQPPGFQTLAIGDAAPAFELPGIDDESYTLASFEDHKVLVLMFTCNHCPSAQAVEERFKAFVTDYASKGVGVVAISPNSPNSPKGIRPDELGYSTYGDSFEDMKKHAVEQSFNFPYLYDGDAQAVAKAYGCLATPHVFVFDAERKLRYKGRFDDSRFVDPATIKSHDTINAVNAILAGEEVVVTETRPHGCSTKWATKEEAVKAHAERLNTSPVEVEVLNADRLKELLKPNGRFRMVNLWATWCVPCVAEFPELIQVSRKFGLRDFEFNSISMDKPNQLGRVKAFLKKQGATPDRKLAKALAAEERKAAHFLYTGSHDDLAKILDPEWPGPIPHTVLIDGEGTIVARFTGRVHAGDLIEPILDSLGKYYKPK